MNRAGLRFYMLVETHIQRSCEVATVLAGLASEKMRIKNSPIFEGVANIRLILQDGIVSNNFT